MMKKGFPILLCLIFLFYGYLYVEAKNIEVNVRFGETPERKRIVFEAADETFIRNTSALVLDDSVRIKFPSVPVLIYRNDIKLDFDLQDNVVIIRIKEPFKIKTLYLNAPARLSIDILKRTQTENIPSTAKALNSVSSLATPVIIDPGHGGYDIGIISNNIREKDITLAIARELKSLLIKKNRPVFLTRRTDQYLSITDRAIAANQKTPGVFISLHLSLLEGFVINIPYIDASKAEPAEGVFEMRYRQRRYIDKSKVFADAIGKAIKEDLKAEVVYREIPIELLRSIGAPAILVEIPGSITFDKDRRKKLVQALLKGIEYANQ